MFKKIGTILGASFGGNPTEDIPSTKDTRSDIEKLKSIGIPVLRGKRK